MDTPLAVPAPVPDPTLGSGPAAGPAPGLDPGAGAGPGAGPVVGPPPEGAPPAGPPLPEALAGAPLLAAGVLDALGRRRRTALWRTVNDGQDHTGGRGAGDDFPAPSPEAAAAHDALRVGADPAAVRFLDRALSGLAEALAARHVPPPVVYAAWVTGEELHVQFAEDQEQPPPPWQSGQSAQFWSIQRARVHAHASAHTHTDGDRETGEAGEAREAAPYPGLVGLGTRGQARLLLNLESVPGLVSIAGAPEERTGVLASAAAELATSGRADTAAVTLVGFGAELAALAPGRVRHLADVPGLLRALETGNGAGAPTSTSPPTSAPAPAQAPTPGRGPRLVLVGAEPTGEEAERLAALAADPALRCGFLVGHTEGHIPGAVWEFTLRDGVLRAPPLDLELRAQSLSRELRSAVVELFTATERVGDPTEGRGPAFRANLSDGGRPDVYARLLGPYEILGLAEPETAESGLLHEALALLLLHREGLHPRVLAAALRHHGVGDDGCGTLVYRLGAWLGTELDGTPRLGTDRDGRLVLRPSVVSDWDVLRTLHHGITGERGTRLSPPVRGIQLADALELARGPLLADRAEGTYGWLAHELGRERNPLLVAEIGLALAAAHLRHGEAPRAVDAVRAALRTAPADRRLREELLRTARATGERSTLGDAEDLLSGLAPARPEPGSGPERVPGPQAVKVP